MTWILSKIIYVFAWVAVTLHSDYLKDCVTDFHQQCKLLGYGVDWHWLWITLPTVRRVFSELIPVEKIKMKPMNRPSGLVFNLNFEENKGLDEQ